MSTCEIVKGSERWVTGWMFVDCYPVGVVSDSVGHAVAVPMYVWRREFTVDYRCRCGDKSAIVTVDGNFSYYTEKGYAERLYPVRKFSIALPLRGVLDALASRLGVSLDVAVWWIEWDAVRRDRPLGPDSDQQGQTRQYADAPKAVCGEKIILPTGREIPWPEEEEEDEDMSPEELAALERKRRWRRLMEEWARTAEEFGQLHKEAEKRLKEIEKEGEVYPGQKDALEGVRDGARKGLEKMGSDTRELIEEYNQKLEYMKER